MNKKLLNGAKVGGKTYKVHLDGYNMVPYLTGEAKESPRNAIMYFSDDGDVIAVRVGDYKFHLAVQRANTMQTVGRAVREASVAVHHEPPARPVRAGRVQLEHLLGLDGRSRTPDVSDAGRGGGRIEGFEKFPPRQKPASFNLDAVLAQVTEHAH